VVLLELLKQLTKNNMNSVDVMFIIGALIVVFFVAYGLIKGW